MRLAGGDDYHQRQAREFIPPGFGIVAAGPIFPDDLVYCWPGGGFEPASSSVWASRLPDDASDAVLVVRRAVEKSFAPPTRRTYVIRKTPIAGDAEKGDAIATAKKASQDPQRSLF